MITLTDRQRGLFAVPNLGSRLDDASDLGGVHALLRAAHGAAVFLRADNRMLLDEAAGIGSADLDKIDIRGVAIKDAVLDCEAFWKHQMPEEKA